MELAWRGQRKTFRDPEKLPDGSRVVEEAQSGDSGSHQYFLGVVSFRFLRLIPCVNSALWVLLLFVFDLIQTACGPLGATEVLGSR